MRDHRKDPAEDSDITDFVNEHTGEGLVRVGRHTPRNKKRARIAKASRRKNR
jgi:hypothetical protein